MRDDWYRLPLLAPLLDKHSARAQKSAAVKSKKIASVMDKTLRKALETLVAKRDAGELCDRWADEGGYTSQELQEALDVIEAALAET